MPTKNQFKTLTELIDKGEITKVLVDGLSISAKPYQREVPISLEIDSAKGLGFGCALLGVLEIAMNTYLTDSLVTGFDSSQQPDYTDWVSLYVKFQYYQLKSLMEGDRLRIGLYKGGEEWVSSECTVNEKGEAEGVVQVRIAENMPPLIGEITNLYEITIPTKDAFTVAYIALNQSLGKFGDSNKRPHTRLDT